MCIHYCKGLGRWKDANGEEMAESEFPGGHEIDITKAEYEGKKWNSSVLPTSNHKS